MVLDRNLTQVAVPSPTQYVLLMEPGNRRRCGHSGGGHLVSLCWILGLFLALGMLNHQLVNVINQ